LQVENQQQITKLQKELQKVKADHGKEKALLMQEIDHFKMERDDIAERLEGEKRMN